MSGMSVDLGRFGIWRRSADTPPEVAEVVESLGFGAFWVGGSPPGGLVEVEAMLAATETIPVATGIVKMWGVDPEVLAASYHRVEARHPGRFLLGVGIGHPESTSEYRDPVEMIIAYLDALSSAGVPKEHLLLAALGPKVLGLSAERTAGAHPYLSTPRHTRLAREVLGTGPLLAPEQTVIVGIDPDEAAPIARSFVTRYLGLVNYRNSLLREGWSEADFANGGSDRLVSELVLTGDAREVAAGIRAHIDAGADHVCIQDIGPDPVSAYRSLAGVLL